LSKWHVVLSTTEPHNYIGIVKVRQGNKNSEILEAQIVENGLPFDLSGCKVYFESIVGGKYPVQLASKITDAKQGKIQYVFDEYSMQCLHRQTADFIIFKDEEIVATTQDFSYFVINAVSKTEGEMGSYWQSVEDLIADMIDFITENQGDFTSWMNARKSEFEAWRDSQKNEYLVWFESIKDILADIDPGGKMLLELMNARVDIAGVTHGNITDRLVADMEFFYKKLKDVFFTIEIGDVVTTDILEDDLFSTNHDVDKVSSVDYKNEDGALIIATIDDKEQDTFFLEKVGEI
jgi:hypothetical protein